MVFNYEWSNRENGNFAIRKRSVRGIEAGKRIEPKENQTSDTHFFIFVNNNLETMSNLYRINKILETIEYDYRQRGTDKKSGTPYLTKKDIENVLNNIDQYKNKTIKIETAFSNTLQQEKLKQKELLKKFEVFFINLLDDNGLKDINSILVNNLKNDNKLKIKKLEAKKQIIQLNKEINRINNDVLKFEKTIQTKKEENEKKVYSIIKDVLKNFSFDLPYSSDTNEANFTNFLNYILYNFAKKQLQNEKASDRQQKYRDRKNEKNGIPKRKRGRPRKTNK
jgi:hypothetical protein